MCDKFLRHFSIGHKRFIILFYIALYLENLKDGFKPANMRLSVRNILDNTGRILLISVSYSKDCKGDRDEAIRSDQLWLCLS